MMLYTILSLLLAVVHPTFNSSDYEEVQGSALPYNPSGWYSNRSAMENLLKQTGAKVVIELGSWTGLSTCHFASVIAADGVVYAVDHWKGSSEHHENESYRKQLPTLYRQFLSNVLHEGLEHKIVPVKMSTLDAAKLFKEYEIYPDLVYVDASHDSESVYQDCVAYYPLVEAKGGVLCGDDWTWAEVRDGVHRFAKEKKLRIKTVPGCLLWIVGP